MKKNLTYYDKTRQKKANRKAFLKRGFEVDEDRPLTPEEEQQLTQYHIKSLKKWVIFIGFLTAVSIWGAFIGLFIVIASL